MKYSNFIVHYPNITITSIIFINYQYFRWIYLSQRIYSQFLPFENIVKYMLTRQKIKMEDSFQQIQPNLPYFQQQEATYASKYSKNSQNNRLAPPQIGNSLQHIKYPSFKTDYSEDQARPHAARNQILKELRQQYEILRNLSIEESVHVPVKKPEPHYQKFDQKGSSLSSSLVSKENKTRENITYKQSNRQIQSLYLEKKQLELVIGNSMRKIEELLNNQISLKKTIHQLKNQIQGKGGITMEYQKTIRSLQKNQEELQGQLNKLKHENDKNIQKIKDQNDKIRNLQSQQQKKERQLKQTFDQQRRIHELLRVQKDRYLNLQIQCRSYKMQFQMLEKQKNNEINRLIRQFQSKEGGNQKEMAFIIKKLQDQIKQKDRRYHDLLLERQKRKETQSDVIPLEKYGEKDKSYLQQIVFRSREINQNNNKAFTDGMNMIFAKMAELQKKNDESIKKEIQRIRKKTEEVGSVRKNSQGDKEFSSRIIQLQRIIERQVSQKQKLQATIKELNNDKNLLEDKIKEVEKKLKEHYSRKENGLVEKFTKEFDQISSNYHAVQSTYNTLKAEYVVISQKLKSYESQEFNFKQTLQNQNIAFKEKQKKLQEEIRSLKRRIDQASFQAEKNKKEGQMNLNIYKTSQQSENKRLLGQNQRISLKLRQAEERLTKTQRQLQNKLKLKQAQASQLKNIVENLKMKLQEEIMSQKKIYEDRISQIESRHSIEIKGFSEKFIGVTSVNEKLMGQLAQMGRLESQLMQLRRVLKQNRNTSSGVDHLWQIKETEYGNITHILNMLNEGYQK